MLFKHNGKNLIIQVDPQQKQWNAFKEEMDKAWEPCAEFLTN
ncbi:MAG: hypothetical protein CM15mP126_3790 [Gammaproteobacteria bacterium]|nr:MAG: hypothetical protein CM15mP126_3790 [Gammaproteobacteria bacterium]